MNKIHCMIWNNINTRLSLWSYWTLTPKNGQILKTAIRMELSRSCTVYPQLFLTNMWFGVYILCGHNIIVNIKCILTDTHGRSHQIMPMYLHEIQGQYVVVNNSVTELPPLRNKKINNRFNATWDLNWNWSELGLELTSLIINVIFSQLQLLPESSIFITTTITTIIVTSVITTTINTIITISQLSPWSPSLPPLSQSSSSPTFSSLAPS